VINRRPILWNQLTYCKTYGTEEIGIECEPNIKEVQQEEEEWCLADSIEQVLFKDEDSNSLNQETLWRQDHDHGICKSVVFRGFSVKSGQRNSKDALRTLIRLNIVVGNSKR
jgi:hypothetical protein